MLSKKLKLKRRRFDAAYIFASVFAVFGGLALLGTYAAHNPPPTFSQGTYSLSKFATTEPNAYNFGIKQGMTYCFTSFVTGDSAQVSITNSDGVTASLVLMQTTPDQACFIADKTYEKALITLPSANVSPTSLVVIVQS